MRGVTFIPLFLALTACASGPYPVTSPYYYIPAGSKVILKQELTIQPNAARVYIQYGHVVTPKEKDNFHAHCSFLSWKVLNVAQHIKPDTFIITKTEKYEDVVQNTASTKQIASIRLAFGMFTSGAPMALIYKTKLTLHSETQPDIRRLICEHWENPDDAYHLTVAQMQQALGDIAEIQVKSTAEKNAQP